MNRTIGIASVAVGTILAFSACSHDSQGKDAQESSPSGENVAGSGYTLIAPGGTAWKEVTSKIKDKQPEIDIAYKENDAGAVANFNVVKTDSATDSIDSDAVKREVKQNISSIGAENIKFHKNTTVDGDKGMQVSMDLHKNGKDLRQYQVYASHGDNTYTLTTTETSRGNAEDMAHDIVGSWKWSNA